MHFLVKNFSCCIHNQMNKFASAFVRAAEPFVTDYKLVKGVSSEAIRHAYEKPAGQKSVEVVSNEVLSIRYFSPSHFLSFFRKSKPAIWYGFNESKVFNGAGEGFDKRRVDEYVSSRRSFKPFDKAHYRNQARRAVSKLFIEQFHVRHDTDAKKQFFDGIYRIKLNKVPVSEQDFKIVAKSIDQCFNRIENEADRFETLAKQSFRSIRIDSLLRKYGDEQLPGEIVDRLYECEKTAGYGQRYSTGGRYNNTGGSYNNTGGSYNGYNSTRGDGKDSYSKSNNNRSNRNSRPKGPANTQPKRAGTWKSQKTQ